MCIRVRLRIDRENEREKRERHTRTYSLNRHTYNINIILWQFFFVHMYYKHHFVLITISGIIKSNVSELYAILKIYKDILKKPRTMYLLKDLLMSIRFSNCQILKMSIEK